MKKLFFIGLPVVACSLLANISLAEEIEEIVVNSSLIDASASEISNPIHVLDGKSISTDIAQSLGSLIDGLAGVSSSDFGAAVGQPVIRGLSGNRVRVLNNGKVVRDISSLGPDHANEIDLGHLQQIEIVRGPSSLLYANGAIGGIVNVVDNTIAKQDFESPTFNLGAGYEDGNSGNTGSASYAGNIAGVNLTSSIQYANLDNYNIPEHALHEDEDDHDHDEHDAKTLENSDFARTGFKLGLSKVEDWGYVGISYADSSSTYGIPFHGEEHDDHEGDHESERVFTDIDSQTVNFEGKYNFNGGLVKSADYHIRSTSYAHTEQHAEEHHDEDEEEEEEEHHDEGTLFENNANEFSLTLDIDSNTAIQKLTLNIAQEDFSITGEEVFLAPTQSDEITLGYFTSNEFDVAHVDFGVRYDQIERQSSAGNYDDNLTSFSATISRDLSDKLGISLGVSSMQKAPSAMELFVDGPHLVTQRFEKGDVSLRPEKANNIDLGFNTAIAGFDANLSLYKNNISNYIYLQDAEGEQEELTVSEYRQQDAVFKGYELELSRSLALKNGSLEVSLARDYVDAQFKQGGYIPRSVPTRNIVNLSYNGNNDLDWLLSIKDIQQQSKVAIEEHEEEESEVGADHDHDHNETATDGYLWVNFSLSKEIKTSENEVLSVSLFAKNLLNKVARNHTSFVKDEVPLPGRNIGIRANYSF